ncbi:peroxidase 66-like [Macadamia integrifolia]|uniref:peroxidase 66-like n=1 Tax=Macadamia integrifolia TaxID=60698 RepID=UPI001C534207|nr:peroxidase 66-like [Macadamia integrifolia]
MAVGDGPLSIATLTVICMVLGSSATVTYGRGDGHHLHVQYYKNTCPQAENIIREAVMEAVTLDPGVAAALVRLQFHDCFVNGCDASILLEETPSREPVEVTSPSNVGVRGFEVIDEAKTRLEKECPGTVSCADIVAFAARDASVASGIRHYLIPAGRRDGLASRAIDTKGNLPKPSSNVSVMANIFTKKGLNLHDLVTLLGSHSFGVSHCSSFDYRLYNFSQMEAMDPQLDMLFAFTLKLACPKVDKRDFKVHFDYITPNRLDNFYYLRILYGKGLLYSDQVLLEDPQAREIVARMAFDPDYWNMEFGKAMIRLGRTDVLTGTQGEIRRQCRFVNQ